MPSDRTTNRTLANDIINQMQGDPARIKHYLDWLEEFNLPLYQALPNIRDLVRDEYRVRKQAGNLPAYIPYVPDPRLADLPDYALSVLQPMAYAITHLGCNLAPVFCGDTNFRGHIAIHTSVHMHHGAEWLRNFGYDMPLNLPENGIIGTAEIIDCNHNTPSRWNNWELSYVLAHATPVPYIPYKGGLGLFRPMK